MIQNAVRLVFNEPKTAHVTPLFISLHWLPVAARIKFKTLMLAYRTTTGSAPAYFHSLMTIYIHSRSQRSASERRLVVPSQRGSKSLSRTFSFTTPGWWNDLPTPIRNAGSLSTFVRLVPMCLCQCVWAPPLEDKRPPWESTKAVSCICHPGRSTLGESTKLSLAYVTVTSRGAAHWGIHTLYWRSHHFPLPSPLRIHWKIHAM